MSTADAGKNSHGLVYRATKEFVTTHCGKATNPLPHGLRTIINGDVDHIKPCVRNLGSPVASYEAGTRVARHITPRQYNSGVIKLTLGARLENIVH